MPSEAEIAWLAGLLEGEGWFGSMPLRRNAPKLQVTMGDRDAIQRAATVVGGLVGRSFAVSPMKKYRAQERSQMYRLSVAGTSAEIVMKAVRPWMCARRGSTIDQALHFWYRTIGPR